jgi:hypothetical protein
MNHQPKTERAIHGLRHAANALDGYAREIDNWQETFDPPGAVSPYVAAFKEHMAKAVACLYEMVTIVEGGDIDPPKRNGVVSEYTDLMGDTLRIYNGATAAIVTIQRHGDEDDSDYASMLPIDKIAAYALEPLAEIARRWGGARS